MIRSSEQIPSALKDWLDNVYRAAQNRSGRNPFNVARRYASSRFLAGAERVSSSTARAVSLPTRRGLSHRVRPRERGGHEQRRLRASTKKEQTAHVGKSFRGKLCVYCGTAKAGTEDHVVGRQFFLPNRRDGLPKVPACTECNNNKSRLEHHLMSVLPFGGEHPDSTVILQRMVPKRLAKNPRLRRILLEGAGKTWTRTAAGLHVQTMTLPVHIEAMKALFALIARGLMWHHWREYLGPSDHATVEFLTEGGERFFRQRFFGPNVRERVSGDLGAGTFRYEGVQGLDYPQLTVWLMSLYGLKLGGDNRAPGETASYVGVITRPGGPVTCASRPG